MQEERNRTMNLLIIYIVIFGTLQQSVLTDVSDYCTENVLTTNDNYMQFTKEPTNYEYAIVGKFKALHCCAKGYRSIEW